MRIIKWILGVLAALAVIVFVGGYFLPKESVVARSIELKAPPEKVFAEVSNLKAFSQWSPWAAMDKEMKITFEGADGAVGQKMIWDSAKLGKGSETITAIVPNSKVAADLDFGFGKNVAVFDLVPSGTGTKVTWTLTSNHDGPIERWFGLAMGSMVGGDFETGLQSLKARVEAQG